MLSKKWVCVIGLAVVASALSVSAQVSVRQAPFPNYQGGNEFFAANLGIWYNLVPYGYGGGGFTSNQGNYNPNFPPGGSGFYPQQAPYQAPYQAPAPVTYGARLSRYPVAGSACAYLQLEPGDMIISLDNLPFYGPNDVLAHVGQTSMVFVNVRTGQPQPAELLLPQ